MVTSPGFPTGESWVNLDSLEVQRKELAEELGVEMEECEERPNLGLSPWVLRDVIFLK